MTWMRAEIEETPAAIARLLFEGAAEAAAVAATVRAFKPRWATIAGRGTSDCAATYARYLFEVELGIPTGLAAPSVSTIYGNTMDWRAGLVVGVSQSGESPDIVEVVSRARAGGALTVAVTNEPGSPLAMAADHLLECRAGSERAVAATKTYVAELVGLAALVAAIRPAGHLVTALTRLPAALERAISAGTEWLESTPVVEAFAGSDRATVISRGFNLATALEIALKLKESAGIFADGYSSADFEHGPIALACPAVPVLAFRPDGEAGTRIDGSLRGLGQRGVVPWVVGGREASGHRALAFPLDLPDALTPPVVVLPGQLLTEAVAVARGRDPDRPIGLTKVTLTR